MIDDLRISVEDVQRRMQAGEKFIFLDVRNPQAWAESSDKLPGAIRVSLDDLDETLPSIPKDKPLVAYCT